MLKYSNSIINIIQLNYYLIDIKFLLKFVIVN